MSTDPDILECQLKYHFDDVIFQNGEQLLEIF